MNQIWMLVLVVIALLVITRMRSRSRRSSGEAGRSTTPALKLSGYQVQAYIHPRMSRACLFDHGMQFGRGFRRKEGPELPHDADCRCRLVPFSFTSSEVFNGALRNLAPVESSLPGLSERDARRLVETLRSVEGGSLPESEAAYLEACEIRGFDAASREAVTAFFRERYRYLQGAEPGDAGAARDLGDDETSGSEAEAAKGV